MTIDTIFLIDYFQNLKNCLHIIKVKIFKNNLAQKTNCRIGRDSHLIK
jgi:hypothetical protein